MVNYTGAEAGQIPGLFGDSDSKGATGPYLWWSFGAIWDAMVDYQYFTGDNQYNDVVQKALLWQRGQDDDYMPANQTKDEVFHVPNLYDGGGY